MKKLPSKLMVTSIEDAAMLLAMKACKEQRHISGVLAARSPSYRGYRKKKNTRKE